MTLSILHTVSQIQQTEKTQWANTISWHKTYAPEKVHLGDIDIAYRILETGDPVLHISPAHGDMNVVGSFSLSTLSTNHMEIVFDNLLVVNTSTGTNQLHPTIC
jgi:hypothetical protein